MMFIDSYDDVEQVTGLKYLNTVQDQNCTYFFKQWTTIKSKRIDDNEVEQQNKIKVEQWTNK
jgi:hypothetical protein